MCKYREMLANGKAHGLIHPTMDQTEESIGIMKEMGFSTDLIFGKSYMPWYGRNFGGRLTFDNMMQAKEAAEKCKEFYMRTIGHTDGVLVGYGDE